MCILITGTLPADINLLDIEGVLKKYTMHFSPINNEAIKTQIRPDGNYYSLTNTGCDCNTGLGSYDILNVRYEHPEFKKMSDDEFNDLVRTVMPDLEQRNERLLKDAQRWSEFIKELLEKNDIKRFGLLIHFYSVGVEEEEFVIKDIVQKSVLEVNIDYLIKMEKDVLYQITA